MSNKPFNSECKNVLNEVSYNVVPSAFGMNNVTAMQTQQHIVCDTVSTSIIGDPYAPVQPQMSLPYSNPCNNVYFNTPNNPEIMYARKVAIPGGVSFFFDPIHHQNVNCLYQQYSTPHDLGTSQQQLVQQQILLKQIEKDALELMLIQDQLSKSGFKFHYQEDISTSNLPKGPNKSQGMPDFNNLMGILNDFKKELKDMELDISCNKSPTVCKTKKLLLTKSPDLLEKQQKRDKEDIVTSRSESTGSADSVTEACKTHSDKCIQSCRKRICFKGFQGKTKKRKPIKRKRKHSTKKCPQSGSSQSSECSHCSSSSSESSGSDDETYFSN